MSYSDGTTTSGTEMIELSVDCLSISGTTITCGSVDIPMAAIGYAEVSCVDNPATSGCTCSATINQVGGIGVAPGYPLENGVYSIAGNTLAIEPGTQEYTYCVSGTTLTMTPVSTGKTGTVTGSVALQKQ
jgi:hypothetical protein